MFSLLVLKVMHYSQWLNFFPHKKVHHIQQMAQARNPLCLSQKY